jgi:gliding motility-associated-like protein
MRALLRFSFCLSIVLSGLLYSNRSMGQVEILTPDTTICPSTCVDLVAQVNGRTPNFVSLSDDLYTGVINIGFTFNYYGTNYSTLIASSNGYVNFSTGQAGQYSAWAIGQGIPGNPNVLNSIMGFYADILPMPGQGTLDWASMGVAPFRKFVLSFCDVPMFSCTALTTSFQIVLCETTNEIEVHLANVPNCPSWNSGAGIEGIQDASGTNAVPVPGRNYPTQWTAFHSSHRWTPTSATTYSLTSIPYLPIPNANATVSWYENGVTPVGTGLTVNVCPTQNTFYVAQVVNCSDTVKDTVFVTMGGGPQISSFTFTDPTTCGGHDGTITLFGLDQNFAYDVHYRKDGVNQPIASTFSNVNGEITLVNLSAGVYDSIIVYKGFCFSNLVGPIILTDPPVVAAYTFNIHFGCEADTAYFTNNSIQNTFNIWDFGDGNGDTSVNPMHIYPVQGSYNVKLVVSNGACKDSTIQNLNTVHILIADFKENDDSVCTNQTIAFTNLSTATTPTYFWDFGNGDTSTLTNPTYTYTVPGTYRVMMVVTDFIPCSDTIYHTILVDTIPYISFTVTDSVICEGKTIEFMGDYLKTGVTATLWTFGDGNTMPDMDVLAHAFDSSGTYNVLFSATYRNCPKATFAKPITILPYPRIDLGPDTVMCPNGDPIAIGDYKNANNPAASWKWNTGETSAVIAVRHPGIYTAEVLTAGCANSDSIEVRKDCYIDIPNSFTPDGDGVNDYFLPRQLLSKGVLGYKMSIYNRWGQIIFETTHTDGRGWDGKFNDKEQPTGVYVYLIDAILKNGAHEKYQGNVTLMR